MNMKESISNTYELAHKMIKENIKKNQKSHRNTNPDMKIYKDIPTGHLISCGYQQICQISENVKANS